MITYQKTREEIEKEDLEGIEHRKTFIEECIKNNIDIELKPYSENVYRINYENIKNKIQLKWIGNDNNASLKYRNNFILSYDLNEDVAFTMFLSRKFPDLFPYVYAPNGNKHLESLRVSNCDYILIKTFEDLLKKLEKINRLQRFLNTIRQSIDIDEEYNEQWITKD